MKIKYIFFIVLLTLSTNLVAENRFYFKCSNIENEITFTIKGKYTDIPPKNFNGYAHTFSISKEFKSIEGCRPPWYEKFPVVGNYDVKFHYHEHEYVNGCMLRFVFSNGEQEGRMWVYSKGNPMNKSDVMKAICNVTKIK